MEPWEDEGPPPWDTGAAFPDGNDPLRQGVERDGPPEPDDEAHALQAWPER